MNIVIVGRPNVGKSSLFNRLLGRKRALVLDTPGVTRDRIVEPATFWVRAREYTVNLIDTGGLGEGQFRDEIKNQVETALKEASIVLFVVDIKREHIAIAEAQKLGIPVFALVDTNSNPNEVEFPIPANDDAFKSVSLLVHAFGAAIEEGLSERKKDKDDAKVSEEEEAKRAVDAETKE